MEQRFALTVKSRPMSSTDYPIIATAFWRQQTLNLTGQNPAMQILYVAVTKGKQYVLL